MRRWLVIFASGAPEGPDPIDATFVDVVAKSALEATRKARVKCNLLHPWSVSLAYEWAVGVEDAEHAARLHERKRRRVR